MTRWEPLEIIDSRFSLSLRVGLVSQSLREAIAESLWDEAVNHLELYLIEHLDRGIQCHLERRPK